MPPLPLLGAGRGLGKMLVPPLPSASEAIGPAVGASLVLVLGESWAMGGKGWVGGNWPRQAAPSPTTSAKNVMG